MKSADQTPSLGLSLAVRTCEPLQTKLGLWCCTYWM